MSPGPEFFDLPKVRAVLERAATSAGVPLGIHAFANEREGKSVAHWGSCEVCTHVNGIPAGERACRQSRRLGSVLAVAHEAPNANQCHLGLGIVAVTPKALPDFVLTFGPYYPTAETRALAYSVCAGLSELLGTDVTEPPVSLDDIHRTPKGALTAIAEWTAEALNREAELIEESPPPEPDAVQERSVPAPQPAARIEPPFLHGELAVALSGGDQSPVRNHLSACLAELGERATAAKRGGAVSITVSRLLEVCHGAGADLSQAWGAFAEFAAGAAGHATDRALIDAAVRVLTSAKWPLPKEDAPSSPPLDGVVSFRPAPPKKAVARLEDAELNRILLPRIAERLPLSEVAELLHVSPSAITHRLQRRFGLSYTEYLGRLRAEKAKGLLRRTRMGLTEVASRVGISDPSNLGRLFRRHVGMGPNEYRSRYGRNS